MDAHNEPRWLTPGDAAKRSPYSVESIRQALRTGELPAERTPGGQYLIAVDDLERWIAASPRGATIEAQRA